MADAPEISLVSSLVVPDLGSVLADIGEVGLDTFLNDGILRDIPVIGTAVNLFKAGAAIRDRIYVRKIALFLKGVAEAPIADRRRFTESMGTDAEKRKFGQAVLLLLERLDDFQKPIILGRIMAAHVRGDIEAPVAYRLCAMVDRCYMPDLAYLPHFKPGVQRDKTPIAETLQAVGFLSQGGYDGGVTHDPDSGGNTFAMNVYGELLLKYGGIA